MYSEIKGIYRVILYKGRINEVFATKPDERGRQTVWVYDGTRHYSYWGFPFMCHWEGIQVINNNISFRVPEEYIR